MTTTLSTSEMKKIVRRHFDDFVNNKKPEVIRQNMTADFLDHDGPNGAPTDVEGDEAMMRGMYVAIPDLHVEIEEIIAGGTCAARSASLFAPESGDELRARLGSGLF